MVAHHRTAGREHGVDNQRGAFVHAVHEFFKIGNGFERFFVALQSDHADFGSRNQVEHAVEHTQTGTQNRDDGQGFALDAVAFDLTAPA